MTEVRRFLPRVKILYIASLVVLVALIVFTVFRSMVVNAGYIEVQREQLVKADNEWIIQLDIINHEGKTQDYIIKAMVHGVQYSEDVSLMAARMFTYIRHIPQNIAGDGSVTLAIYKNGEAEPFRHVTYYLK